MRRPTHLFCILMSLTDMQHRFASKAAVHETLRDICNLRPGGLDFDLRAQAPSSDETAQASKIS